MTKSMIIETRPEEVRVAISEDGQLIDFNIEMQSSQTIQGNIYKGIITNVERSLAAVFVDFGAPKQGFLPISEIPLEALGTGASSDRPISEQLKRKQEIVVQVTRDPIGHKGAALTGYLSIAGRYCVLMSDSEGKGGVSRKIEDEAARKKAKEMLAKLRVPAGKAVIIRTAGMGQTKTDLQRDLSALSRTYKGIEKATKIGRAPTLLYREPDLVVRTIRDYLLPDIEEIILDDSDEYAEALEFFETTMPKQKDQLKLYQDKQPLFARYGVDEQIAATWSRKVRLPSGGELVIDPTEALVAIDVNSARSTKKKSHEETIFFTNKEAAVEVARQLRLRDLGGIIVIDFIDHAQRAHDREIEKILKDALKADKAKINMGKISRHGTLELTRQRLRQAHASVATSDCPTCGGSGRVRSPQRRAAEILRELMRRAAQDPEGVEAIRCTVDVGCANVLVNAQRSSLMRIEEQTGVRVEILASATQSTEPSYQTVKRAQRLPEIPASARGELAPVPPSSASPAPQVSQADDDDDDEAEPTKKKRRRRRRRGGRSADSGGDEGEIEASQDAEAPAEGASPLEAEAETEASDLVQAEPEPAFSDDPLTEALFGPGPMAPDFVLPQLSNNDDETGNHKRKRRRRRRKPRVNGGDSDASADTEATDKITQAPLA